MELPGPQLEAPEWVGICPAGPKAAQEGPSSSGRGEPHVQMVSDQQRGDGDTRRKTQRGDLKDFLCESFTESECGTCNVYASGFENLHVFLLIV